MNFERLFLPPRLRVPNSFKIYFIVFQKPKATPNSKIPLKDKFINSKYHVIWGENVKYEWEIMLKGRFSPDVLKR